MNNRTQRQNVGRWNTAICFLLFSAFASFPSYSQNTPFREPVELEPVEWSDIIEEYLEFREQSWPLVVPDSSIYGSWDEIIRNVGWGKRLGWFWNFGSGNYRMSQDSLPEQKEPVPVPAAIYEDIYSAQIFVLALWDDGNVYELYKEPVVPLMENLEKGFPLDEELSMRRIVWKFNALPHDYVIPESDEAELLAREIYTPLTMRTTSSYPPGSIYITIERAVLNPSGQIELTVHTPTGDVQRIDVFTHTNLLECTPWTLLVDAQFVDADGKLTFFDDIELLERRYYAAANSDVDSDGDGLSDGRERWIYQTDPYNPDTDGDGMPDGWEVMHGLNPNCASDADIDSDGDGFSNALEYTLGSPPDNPAWNGAQLVYALMRAHSNAPPEERGRSVATNLLYHSLKVKIEDSANCGGSGGTQYETDTFTVPDLLECGYFVDITVGGNVEDHMSWYDHVFVSAYTQEFFFGGNHNFNDCTSVYKEETKNLLVLPNSEITLIYDTVSYKHHVDGYAEIINAVDTGILKISFEYPLYHFCHSSTSEELPLQVHCAELPGNLAWSGFPNITGDKAKGYINPSSGNPGTYTVTSQSDIFGCVQATTTVKVHRVAFETNNAIVGWSSNGTYAAWDNVTSDSYDISDFHWSLTTLDGDSTATINPTNGLVNFGTTSGGRYRIRADTPAGNCYAVYILNIVSVSLIDVVSHVEGDTPNPPPFPGHHPWPFNPTNSPNPDKHLVVFYNNVIDQYFDVQDFDIHLSATLVPPSITESELNVEWVKIEGPDSGSFERTDLFNVKYQNPIIGGIYHLALNLNLPDSLMSECVFVLPLAGAEIDDIVINDLVLADAFASVVVSNYSWLARQNPLNGKYWFVDHGAGDYRGRPDSQSCPTVWFYNQVNTSSHFGLGAVATWKGYPTRLSKVSNFMVAYAARKINVNPVAAWLAQIIGTFNDDAASDSWDAGWTVGGGANYNATVIWLVADIWDKADDKNMKLWPNQNHADNYVVPNIGPLITFWDPNTQFTSPGFLHMQYP